MIRDIDSLGARLHDVIVIGGGITGSTIAREAALRGLAVALVEARDFSAATSSATTKLVHGGLRYLRSLEFGLVRESLAERRIWQATASHLVHPVPFLLPVDRHDRWVMSAGLTLYDLLSFDRNRLPPGALPLPGHRLVNAHDLLAREPVLAGFGATGALVYYDCQMNAPERLGLECLIDAARNGAQIANYVEATGRKASADSVETLEVRDVLTGHAHLLRARTIVNAAGPWADELAHRLDLAPESVQLIRSKGIHLITRPLTRTHALTLPVGDGHLFIIPWRGHSIVGTTDTAYDGDPARVGVTRAEIMAFLAHVNGALPEAHLTFDDVRHAYAGLRPLVAQGGEKNTYGASRRAEIVAHAQDGGRTHIFSAVGGKWTTSRHLAERVVTRVEHALHRSPLRSTTAIRPLPGGAMGQPAHVAAALADTAPFLSVEQRTALAHHYGALALELAELAREAASLQEPLARGGPAIAAQIVYAVQTEMAQTLGDVAIRRLGLGTQGPLAPQLLARIAEIMAPLKGWDDAECRRQIVETETRLSAWRQ